jgi:DNA-binding transcriptional LysR family regulator
MQETAHPKTLAVRRSSALSRPGEVPRWTLTTAGESLLSYAKRLLELNDEAIGRLHGADVEGWACLGLPQDFAESWLPAVLHRYSGAHPRVQVEAQSIAAAP